MKKLDFIDSLRGIAVLMVLMVHSRGNEVLPEFMHMIINTGSRGVQLFFILSALTLFLSFEYRSKNEKRPVLNFFIRRFFRIAPLFYIAVFYYLFQNGFGKRYWLGDENEITIYNILSNLTFLNGFNPHWINSIVEGSWSIAIEMLFYLTIPLLFKYIKNINQAILFFMLSMVFSFYLNIIFMRNPLIENEALWGEYLFFYFPNQLPIFAIGIIMYFICFKTDKIGEISGNTILLFGGLLYIQLSLGYLFLSFHIFYGIIFLIVGLTLYRYKNKLLVNSFLSYVGKLSYSIYLNHAAVLFLMYKLNFTTFFNMGITDYSIRFLFLLFFTIILSYLTHRFVELPSQKFGNKLINYFEK